MKSKIILGLLITIASINTYGQGVPVTIEDKGGRPKYMDDPNYGNYRKEYNSLNRKMDVYLTQIRGVYTKNIQPILYENGSHYASTVSQLKRFINRARNELRLFKSDQQYRSMLSRIKTLGIKTRGDNVSANGFQVLFNNHIRNIEERIKWAEDRIEYLGKKKEEEKKEKDLKKDNSNNNSNNYNKSPITDYLSNSNQKIANYEAGLKQVTTKLVNVGFQIANSMKNDRIRNVNYKNKKIKEYLTEMSFIDKKIRNLYKNKNYDAFFEQEKGLRLYENKALLNLDWLIEKEGGSNYKNLHTIISEAQLNRLKMIVSHFTNQFIESFKELRNSEIVHEKVKYSNLEIVEYRNGTFYYDGKKNNVYKIKSTRKKYRNEFDVFTENEGVKRIQKLLEYNEKYKVLNTWYEVNIYLRNKYYKPEYNKKAINYFKSTRDLKSRFFMAKSALYNLKYHNDQSKIMLLLNNDLNYYLDVNLENGLKPKAFYAHLNSVSQNYRETSVNKLVKSWVKRDEKATNKKAKELFLEKRNCLTVSCINTEANIPAIVKEALVYFKGRKSNEALKILQKGIDTYPESAIMYYHYAYIKSRKKNLFSSIKKGIDKKLNVSLAKDISKNDEEAIEYYKKGMGYSKDNSFLLVSFYIGLGEIYHKIKDFDKSVETFEAGLKISPKNTYLLNSYSKILSNNVKNLDRAEKMIKLAIELEPKKYNYQITYTRILYKRGMYKEAQDMSVRATNNGGSRSSILLEYKGDISYKLGNKDVAVTQWKRAKYFNKVYRDGVSEFLKQKIKKKRLIE